MADAIDAMLASNRQKLIIQLRQSGKIDAETFSHMYQAATRPDQVKADREAYEKGELGANLPTGRLGMLLFKLKSGVHK